MSVVHPYLQSWISESHFLQMFKFLMTLERFRSNFFIRTKKLIRFPKVVKLKRYKNV